MGLFGPNIQKMKETKDITGLIDILKTTKDLEKTMINAAIALAEIGVQAIDPFFEAIRDMELKDKMRANVMTGTIGILIFGVEDKDLEDFIKILKNKVESPTLRRGVAMALGLRAEEKFTDILIQILRDKNENSSVRCGIVEALSLLQNLKRRTEIIAGIVQKCNDKEFYNKIAKITLFGGSEKILDTLIKMAFEDEDAVIRSTASEALGEIGDERAFSLLKKLAEEDKPYVVRDAAKEAINLIQNRKGLEHKS